MNRETRIILLRGRTIPPVDMGQKSYLAGYLSGPLKVSFRQSAGFECIFPDTGTVESLRWKKKNGTVAITSIYNGMTTHRLFDTSMPMICTERCSIQQYAP
jgi:hypothetical protein